MDIHGIVASEYPFGRQDPTSTLVSGADISRLDGSCLYLNPGDLPMGIVTAAKKVQTLQDCASDADRGLWDLAGAKPFVRVSARLTLHTEVLGELLKVDRGLLAWYAMGRILERQGDVYTKTVLKDVLFSITGVRHTPYQIFFGKG